MATKSKQVVQGRPKQKNPHINPDSLAHKLVEENKGLVGFVVRTWFHNSRNIDDLLGYGYLGLVKASKRFDPAYGTKFCTYAVPVIKRDMQDGLRAMYVIRVPDSALSTLFQGIDNEYSRSALRAIKTCQLSKFTSQKKTHQRYSDEFQDVHSAMKRTPLRTREIICKRYGIGLPQQTSQEIADEFRITKQRVCQIVEKGEAQIRDYYLKNNIDPYGREEKTQHFWFRSARERERATISAYEENCTQTGGAGDFEDD